MNDLREIAGNENLKFVETTSGANGYPENLRGAIIGFETFDHAEKIAKKYNLEIKEFFKKNGHDLWGRTGYTAYEPLSYGENDFGDNAKGIAFDDYENEADFLKEEVFPFIDEDSFNSFDELNDFLKLKEKIWEEIECMDESEIMIIVSDEFEIFPKTTMYKEVDTNESVIGLELKR